MRPVEKKAVGDIINLYEDFKSLPAEIHIVQEEYSPYTSARKVLISNLGSYCSYCETYSPVGSNLQTEHIQPKGLKEDGVLKYGHLQCKWSNFLLTCPTCNGRGNKGSKDVVLDDIHLPHLNNTFLSLEYKEAGVVCPNPTLTGLSKVHAGNLIELLGLDKPSSETDMRCEMRRRNWDRAQVYLKKYEAGEYTLAAMIDDIKGRDCWSIWYTVFKDHPEVRELLLEFPGTARSCFDASSGYDPIPRNPYNPDPV